MRGEGDEDAGREMLIGKPDLDALDRETKWELAGCIVLLVIAVLMAAAMNLYVP